MMRTLSSEGLTLADIPTVDADLDALIAFAHTFDGYGNWGSFERCAEIANAQDHGSLDKLRTCLFFEARRWRHFGHDPDPEAEQYWRKLVAAVRREVQSRGAIEGAEQTDYRKFYDLEHYLFEEVGAKFRANGYISPIDFYLVLIWKANRAKNKTKNRLANIAGSFEQACHEISTELASASSPQDRLAVLMGRWNFQLPTATAILTILDPEHFTVYDVRACEVLRNCSDLKHLKFSEKLWIRLQLYNKLVQEASPAGLSLRDCDKYLWGKSFYEQALVDCTSPEKHPMPTIRFEGGSVVSRDEAGEFLLVVNQVADLEMLDPSERDGIEPEYTIRFESAESRESYARKRGWWKSKPLRGSV